MNLLADESIEGQVVQRLRSEGHSIEWIAEIAPGASDAEVLAMAATTGRVLLTSDKDFGELIFGRSQPHAGVLLLRLRGLSTTDRSRIVVEAIRASGRDLAGAFVVVTPDAVRLRRSGEADP